MPRSSALKTLVRPQTIVAVSAAIMLWISITSNMLFAVEVIGLYEAELPVQGSSAAERTRLTRNGLEEVIVKVSGGYQVLGNETILDALRKADRYLQQFSYLKTALDSDAQDNLQDNEQQQLLRLQFDATQIDDLLRRARMPIWDKNRPNVLLWVTIDDGQGRRILNSDENSPLKQSILDKAKKRGIPVLFPLMDLADEQMLPLVDAWGLFKEPLQRASVRYQPEAILAGRLYQDAEGQWAGRWQLIFNKQMQGLSATAADLGAYPASAIDLTADTLASYYAVNTSGTYDELVQFEVAGINSLTAYAQVISYLESLAAVIEVSTKKVENETLTLSLTMEGEVEKLTEAIALERKLVPVQKRNPELEIRTLYYSWNNR